VILTTKTGRSYSKRYLAQQWEKTCKAAGIVDLHFHDIRGTTVTMLAEAGCTLPEIVSITGHTLRRAQVEHAKAINLASFSPSKIISRVPP